MQEVIVAHGQLGERILGTTAKMLGEAGLLEVSEERGVVRSTKDATVQEKREEEPPAMRVPLLLEERALCLDRFAGEHPVETGPRMHEDAHRADEHSDEALRHTCAEYAGVDERET